MSNWIAQQQQTAPLDEDVDTYLERIEAWQRRAQKEAEEHSYASTKKAVEEEPPTGDEARALYHLYARHAETIYHVCQQELERASETDALTLEDVLQEAYPRFMRAMVSYDRERGELKMYLAHALRQRIKDYVKANREETDDSEQEQPDDSPIAPGFDIPRLYDEMVEEGRVPRKAERLHDTLT